MEWIDDAIIISARKHGESASIITLFTPLHGLHKGIVRGAMNAKLRGIYQSGNRVQATWKGRLAEHLGMFFCELQQVSAALFLRDEKRLTALSSICALYDLLLPERALYPELFEGLVELLESFRQNSDQWQGLYARLEVQLLSQLGFGMDVSECAATGTTQDLIYISPKSGRAVCKEAGEPYKDKLLPLPGFLCDTNANNYPIACEEIVKALALTGYFLNKYLLEGYNKKMPGARVRLVQLIMNNIVVPA